MGRKKGKVSQAKIKSIRLNPINAEESDVLKIINRLRGEGYNFKQIAVDAILYRDGATPEMYSDTEDNKDKHLKSLMLEVLEEYSSNLSVYLKQAPEFDQAQKEEVEQKISGFTRSFMDGLRQRQSSNNSLTEED